MHRTSLIVALALVIFVASEHRIDVYRRGFWARVRGHLWCKGQPLEAWVLLKTAENPSHYLVSYYTHDGHFDMTANARHEIAFGIYYPPGFLVSIRADCGCGGEYFELPLVPLDYQFEDYSIDAQNNAYNYGLFFDLANCSGRRNPHL